MGRVRWYRWHPSDWRGSARVAALSAEERGVYRELLDLQAELGPFRFDPALLARQLRLDRAEIERAWPAVAGFFEEGPDGFLNSKVEDEVRRGERLREAGQKAAAARWAHPTAEATVERSDMRSHRNRTCQSESESESEKTPLPLQGGGSEASPNGEGRRRVDAPAILQAFLDAGGGPHDPIDLAEARTWLHEKKGRLSTLRAAIDRARAAAPSNPQAWLLRAIRHRTEMGL